MAETDIASRLIASSYRELNEFERLTLDSLGRIEDVLSTLLRQGVQEMAEIDDLVKQVQETRGVEEAAVAAIQGLRDKINELVANATELSDLKAQLSGLTAELDSSERPLAAAIASTPEPTP